MNKKEVSNAEIMEALGQFAQSVDKRFDSVENRLFKMDGRLDNLETDMVDVKAKVNKIYDVFDDHMRRIENILQENQVQKYQQDRLERWIFQLTDKMDIKLKYE